MIPQISSNNFLRLHNLSDQQYTTLNPVFYNAHNQTMQTNLALWRQNAPNPHEHQSRKTAEERILKCSEQHLPNLDLSYLNLSSCPTEIGKLTQLQTLSLNNNSLEELPLEIGELPCLTTINLDHNQFTKFPTVITKLTNLTQLTIYSNKLTSLPEELAHLQELKFLQLSNNTLTSLPSSIGTLSKLHQLWLEKNNLETLPNTIKTMKSLFYLDLSDNQIKTLPKEIGQLEHLNYVNLIRNPLNIYPEILHKIKSLRHLFLEHTRISSLPLTIFSMHQDCRILLEGCPFSLQTFERIESKINSFSYQGPHIFLGVQPHNSNQMLPKLIDTLYVISARERPESQLQTLLANTKNKKNLSTWLRRISSVLDFRVIESRKEFSIKITEYLELADQNPEFRNIFFSIIEDAAATCGDRMALSVIHLGIAKKLTQVDLNNHKELAKLLINEIWVVDQLENFARNKMEQLPFSDEIEVYLAFLNRLQNVLNLPLAAKGMLYFECSGLSQEELDNAYIEVSTKIKSAEQQCAFLVGQDLWNQSLKKLDQERYKLASESEDSHEQLIAWTKQLLDSHTNAEPCQNITCL